MIQEPKTETRFRRSSVSLIGMPGVGKSTLGVLLAKELAAEFIDTDLILQSEQGMRLEQIISREGTAGFRRIEEACVCNLVSRCAVIATGGSVPYSPAAMAHLKEIGPVVWLYLDYGNLVERLGDLNARGVVFEKGQSLLDLYQDREPLYRQYADATVDCNGKTPAEAVNIILEQLRKWPHFQDAC